MLSVRKGANAIDFYKEAFAAVELFRIENESGEIVAQLAVGSAEFWGSPTSLRSTSTSVRSLLAVGP